jgi:competence ComEA-like helix-hairpin-helix protein
MRVKPASSFRGAVLLLTLGLFLTAITSYAIFAVEHVPPDIYRSKTTTLTLPPIPLPQGDIPINTADAKTLELLPGIGPTFAAQIISERDAHGPFHFPEDLLCVSGIGEKKLADILPYIRLDER